MDFEKSIENVSFFFTWQASLTSFTTIQYSMRLHLEKQSIKSGQRLKVHYHVKATFNPY